MKKAEPTKILFLIALIHNLGIDDIIIFREEFININASGP